jgi:hypothetical protein
LLKLREQAKGLLIAAYVAVDMLAISALLKHFLLPENGVPAISRFTGYAPLDCLLFAVVIFLVVFLMVLIAQATGVFVRNTLRMIFLLRLLEPFVVFLLLAGTVRMLISSYSGGGQSIFAGYGLIVDLLFSLLVVVSLIVSNGMSLDNLKSTYKNRSDDREAVNPEIDWDEFFSNLKKVPLILLSASFGLAIIIFSLARSYSTGDQYSHNHLIEATKLVSTAILGCTIIFAYTPVKLFDRLETLETLRINDFHAGASSRLFWRFLGVCIGFLVMNGFILIISGGSPVGQQKMAIDAIRLWSLYVIMVLLLFSMRCLRFQIAARYGVENRSVNDADFSEIISALGIASSVVALLSTEIVMVLTGL